MPKILTQLVTSTISSITASTGAAAGISNVIEVTTQGQASQLAANPKKFFCKYIWNCNNNWYHV